MTAGPAVPETGVLTATDPEWDCACARFAVIAPLAALEVIGHAAADEAAAKLGLSRRQVYALVHRLRTGAGTVTDLLPGRSSGGRGARRLPETVDEVIADHLTRMYLKRQKPSVAVVYRAIVGACVRQQLPVPARNTVAARIAALHPGEVARKREGTDSPAARSRRSAGGTVPSIGTPLEQVQIDHTVVDVMVVDERDRQPIGRPYLTAAIDVFSRCVLGLVLTLEPPSAVSVGLCLGQVCCDKRPWLDSLGVGEQMTWPMSGKPRHLYLDNAAEFHSEALHRGCQQHGIDPNYRPLGRPHYGGIIERLIGTAMTRVHELPGTTFSNPTDRGSYDSENTAALTLTELERWLTLAVASYHGTVHTGLGQTPAGRWADGIAALPAPPPVSANRAVFLLDFLPVLRRRLTRTGFVVDHIHYFSAALKPWIARREQCGKFVLRRDPRDLSRIWVLDPDGTTYLEVPYRTLSRPPITLWEHRAAITRLRERGRTEVDEAALFQMLDTMREITATARKATRTARRNTERRRHLRPPVPAARMPPPPDPDPTSGAGVPVAVFDDIEEW
ncbi:Mu transposase C-terminal domain-containing protein [Rhodococcus koreensis]|uniref:Putative transposase n=1 Tax=Rhodococcus koreensis TaxID=99653 RepID=A0A1H4I7M6_9NOCA|nr:Mu transposase C-terminal domain-containing protein [Rhodococcus koreensis]SEB29900.1 putative transposase [Rhodococcus koreensis]